MRKDTFRVGDWEVLPLEGRIRSGDRVERLRPKAMDVLCLLAASPGEVVERDTILSEVWGRTAVTDEPLTATVGELRRVLGDRRGSARFVETIPKRGYRLVAPVEAVLADELQPDGGGAVPPGEPVEPDGRRWLLALTTFAAIVLLGALFFWRGDATGPRVEPPPESIAVLPFALPGGSGDDLYFGDGLALEILTTLAAIDGLRVAASNSAFEFRDRRGALGEIRDALDVDTVLDGTIRRAGERVRIQVQLVDTRTGYNLWANTYDRELADVFKLQSEIARAIVGQLSVRFLDPDMLLAAGESDSGTYLEYLRGKYLYETARDEIGLRQAIAHLETALAEAPDFAAARATLAGVWTRLGDLAFEVPAIAYENSREQAVKALAVAPDLAQAHLMLGWTRMYYDWNWPGARQSLGTALELAPGDAFVISANAALNFHLGNFERAVALAEMAVERDPLRAASHNNLAYFRYTAGDAAGAAAALERAEELVPGFPGSGMLHVQIDLARGDPETAATRVETHPLLSLLAAVLVRHELGDAAGARAALDLLEREFGDTGPYQIAEAYAWLGDADAAFRWLEVAWKTRDPGMADLKVDRLLAPVREDPRYAGLLARMAFSEMTRSEL